MSTGFPLQQKDQNHIVISNCCQVRNQVWVKGRVPPQNLNRN